ncbi:XkdW family protein [Ralstonia mannitolilytica]|uniref:XkdW family protein n=1 Tax=Ralstonia mannitolilytica TaxID=105219 RepID=UPI0028F5543C|nr:phage tail assembly chaperone [Ralstonia mannitolilytica]CAJ0743345.1 hypothetical protein R76696_04449 [Ralstonia mannitolilytica]
MLTHDELIFCIQQQYPNAVHGTDFWVFHLVDPETGAQLSDAELYEWRLASPAPTPGEIQDLVKQHGAAARAFVVARDVRIERERRLKVADTLVYKAMDTGDMERMRLAGQYRQALRDVTTLPGFPEAFEWPPLPEGLAELLPANV